MNKILVLDTETVDLPSNLKFEEEELRALGYHSNDDIPLAYQLAYMYDDGKKRVFKDCVGHPELPISIASSEITHVTNKDIKELTLQEDGSYITLKETPEFNVIKDLIEKTNNEEIYVVGHNISFDLDILKREGLDLSNCKAIDTLQLSRALDKDYESNRLTYLTYAKEEVLEATRELVKLDQISSVSKVQPMSAHNALFDVVATSHLITHYRDRVLENNKEFTMENVYEELHRITITPFLMEEVPFGVNKGKIITEMNESELMWILKMDINDMNYKYSLEEHLNTFGGYDAVIKRMSNYDLEKLINSNPDYFTNEDLKQKLITEQTSRDVGFITLGFGKHAETNIESIDKSYLEWVRDNNKNPSTMKKVSEELNRRASMELNSKAIEIKPTIAKETLSKVEEKTQSSDNLLEDFLNS